MSGSELRGVTAAVLAGGLGTRLRSVVVDRPKVLAPVAGRPFLAHLLDDLARAGVGETVLLVGHRAEQVEAEIGHSHRGMRLIHSLESEPLGTGGAIRHALPHFASKTVLLLNGDSYCDLDHADFWQFHRDSRSRASLALTHAADASRFGRVATGPRGRVERFEEKNPVAAPGWINAGVYLLDRSLIDEIPAGQPLSLERDLMPAWVANGVVSGFQGGGRFIDIGVPDSYARAQGFFAAVPRGEPLAWGRD